MVKVECNEQQSKLNHPGPLSHPWTGGRAQSRTRLMLGMATPMATTETAKAARPQPQQPARTRTQPRAWQKLPGARPGHGHIHY